MHHSKFCKSERELLGVRAAVREKGYWVQMLQKAGLLDSGAALPTVRKELNTKSRSGPFRSGYLVNRLLSQISDWRTVFTVLRDLEPLFDHINISTAMHRLAKVSYKNKVGRRIPCTTLPTRNNFLHACAEGMAHDWAIKTQPGTCGDACKPFKYYGDLRRIMGLGSLFLCG